VVSVPWQLESSDRVADKDEAEAPGGLYRGIPTRSPE